MDAATGDAQTREPTVLSTAALPYVPVYPAPSHLAWSDDFQACVVTRHEIHLLSPVIGYCFDQKNAHLSGTLSGKPGERADEKEDPAQLKWFQTSIPTESEILWEYYTNDIKDTLIGGSASMWKMARWSPRGTSYFGTCLLAALSTDGEVFIYGPPNIPHRGKWSKAYDLTLTLHNCVMPAFEQRKQNTQEYRRDISTKLSQVQALSIAWSSAPPIRTDPHFASRALLAVGHRSGHITLWSATQTSGLRLLGRIRPAKAWLTALEFSQWQELSGREASVSLAAATSDGECLVLKVTQLSTKPLIDMSIEPTSILSQNEHHGSLKIESSYRSGSQSSPVSGFTWLSPFKLALTRLGVLTIVNMDSVDGITTRQLELQPVGDWQGVNPWAPVSGLVYDVTSDVLVVSLDDGSIHAIAAASTSAPSLEYGQHSRSQSLTDSVRHLIASNEASVGPSRISKALATKILSLTAMPSGELCWLYELERPDLLMYLQDSRHTSKLVISSLHVNAPVQDSGKLRIGFVDPPATLVCDPTATTFTDLIETRRDPSTGVGKLFGLDTILYPEGSDWAKDFLSCMLHLFHSEQAVKEAQLKAFLAFQISAIAPSPEATRSRMLSKKNLAHLLLKRIARALHKFKGPEEEVTLLESVASAIERSHTDEGGLSFEGITKTHECAACRSPIPMENLKVAICSQGHRWDRCALTLRPIFRLSWTCVGCGSKFVQLPNRSEDGQEASLGQKQDVETQALRQPRLEHVAEVVRVCVWCGRHTMSYMGSSR